MNILLYALKSLFLDSLWVIPVAAVVTYLIVKIGCYNGKFKKWIESED